MMKGIYAGGKLSHIKAHTGTIVHTASPGVVFACLSGRDRSRETSLYPHIRLAWSRSFRCASFNCFTPCSDQTPIFHFPLSTFSFPPPTVSLHPSARPLPRRGALSILRPPVQCLSHRLLQRPRL